MPPDPYDVPEDMPDSHPPVYGWSEGWSCYSYLRIGFAVFFGGLLLPAFAFFGLDGPDTELIPLIIFGGILLSVGGIVIITLGVTKASIENVMSPHERMGLWIMVGLLGGFFFLHFAFFIFFIMW